jgi:hypothetical protein
MASEAVLGSKLVLGNRFRKDAFCGDVVKL